MANLLQSLQPSRRTTSLNNMLPVKSALLHTFALRLLLALACMLVACSTQPRKVDTRTWMPVSCSTFLQPGNTCYQEAHALCPQGYDIYNPVFSPGEQRRKMEIACKP